MEGNTCLKKQIKGLVLHLDKGEIGVLSWQEKRVVQKVRKRVWEEDRVKSQGKAEGNKTKGCCLLLTE